MTDRQPSISTHVLDLETGQPAQGVPVTIARLDLGAFVVQSTQETNADGRIADLLGAPLRSGSYQISFDVASYLERRGAEVTFMRRVLLEFEVQDSERHYHVPLLVSRYSCASYRGS